MVGDDVRDDVQGAMDCCMAGILGELGTTVLLNGSQHDAWLHAFITVLVVLVAVVQLVSDLQLHSG